MPAARRSSSNAWGLRRGGARRDDHLDLTDHLLRAAFLEKRGDALFAVVDVHDAQALAGALVRGREQRAADPAATMLGRDGEQRDVAVRREDDHAAALVADDHERLV